jgi:hypothetical protein
VAFVRSGETARRRDSGVRLAATVNSRHIEVALELTQAGMRSMRALLTGGVGAKEIAAAIEALPEQFAFGVAGEELGNSACRASLDELRELLDRAELGPSELWLGWRVPREIALQHADLIDEQLEDAVVALSQLFAALTRKETAAAGRASASPSRGRKVESGPKQGRGAGSQRSVARPRPTLNLRAQGTIEKGGRVRVLEGPFAGKVGIVQELDGKGGARVMLGLLAVRIAVKDLATPLEGRHRPRLSTSHRKPLPVRS